MRASEQDKVTKSALPATRRRISPTESSVLWVGRILGIGLALFMIVVSLLDLYSDIDSDAGIRPDERPLAALRVAVARAWPLLVIVPYGKLGCRLFSGIHFALGCTTALLLLHFAVDIISTGASNLPKTITGLIIIAIMATNLIACASLRPRST